MRLDASIRYDLEELTGQKASIFVDFNNISDESDMRYTAAPWNVNQVESFGRAFTAGLLLVPGIFHCILAFGSAEYIQPESTDIAVDA